MAGDRARVSDDFGGRPQSTKHNHRDPPATMLTPTVTEIPRALEPVGRDTFIAGTDGLATLAAPARIGLAAAPRAADDATASVVRPLAA